jgi:hypothetical protein
MPKVLTIHINRYLEEVPSKYLFSEVDPKNLSNVTFPRYLIMGVVRLRVVRKSAPRKSKTYS